MTERPGAPDPRVRAKAETLHKDGMPFQMAMAVASGRMDFSDALERMARKERAARIEKEHDLSCALATQIAMGHADLESVLRRRRMMQHRENFRDRTILEVGTHVSLDLCDGRTVKGEVSADLAFEVEILPEKNEETVTLRKLELMYGHDPSDWKLVKKSRKLDKALAKLALVPAKRPQDRYGCSDKRLFRYIDTEREVVVTLLHGAIFRGIVRWFSRYEFGLEVRGGAVVVVFRHALKSIK